MDYILSIKEEKYKAIATEFINNGFNMSQAYAKICGIATDDKALYSYASHLLRNSRFIQVYRDTLRELGMENKGIISEEWLLNLITKRAEEEKGTAGYKYAELASDILGIRTRKAEVTNITMKQKTKQELTKELIEYARLAGDQQN